MGAGTPPRRSSMIRPDRGRPGSRRPVIRRPDSRRPDSRGIFGSIGAAAVEAARSGREERPDRRRPDRGRPFFGGREIRPDRRRPEGRRRPPEVPVRKDTPGREINSRGQRDEKFAEFLNIMEKRSDIRRGRTGGIKRFGRGVRR